MVTCGTLEWRQVDHVLLNLKKAKKNEASPRFEPGFLRVMIRDGNHSANQYIRLHIITSSDYNDSKTVKYVPFVLNVTYCMD